MAALHSTDPATPFISAWARVPGFAVRHLEDVLYEERTLIRMHSIRRTLFVFDVADAPAFWAGATADIARKERERLVGMVSPVVGEGRAAAYLDDLAARVVAALGRQTLATRELSAVVPGFSDEIEVGSGKWVTRQPVGNRLLLVLGMEGVLVRARPMGSWRASQYRWAVTEEWLGAPLPELDAEEARAAMLRRYLETHAPATLTDIRWWTGWTAKAAREALGAVEAVEVALEDGSVAYQLPGDPGVGRDARGVIAFLPSLDSSTMGWKERGWYLSSYRDQLFDSVGNAGPTVWVDGRIVGGWGQKGDGTVVYELLEEVPKRTADRIAAEAAALTEWLGERVVMPRFPSPLGRRLAERA